MANMSAKILREIVSRVFDVKASRIKLSGEISPEFIPQYDRGHSWWSGASSQEDTVFGFDPKIGFRIVAGGYNAEKNFGVHFADNTISREYQYSDNGSVQHEAGQKLAELPDADHYILFLVHSEGYGDEAEWYSEWTLYKAPNFAAHWAEIDAADVQRWEEWLK